jgi:hypothetical protein
MEPNLSIATCVVGFRRKAAHLVPKSLIGGELSYLFGEGKVVLMNPRNGITLQQNIEQALDNGIIAIIPIPSDEGQATRWQCVLVDKSKTNRTVFSLTYSQIYKWKDFDQKELVFLTENRPMRRYLYFRFIVTYLFAKEAGFIKQVETKQPFWASPGRTSADQLSCLSRAQFRESISRSRCMKAKHLNPMMQLVQWEKTISRSSYNYS